MTGAELAAALRNLAHLVELQRAVTGLQVEPVPGVTITVRVAPSARASGPAKVGGSAERMRRLRERNRGLFGDEEKPSQPSRSSSLGDAQSKLGDAVADGGIMGGLDLEEGEKSGKETGITGTNLPGQDQETPAARHQANSVTQVGDADSVTPIGDASAPGGARSDGTAAERSAVRRVFDAWQQDTGHHRAILDRKRGRRILSRLREGFTPERLIAAITHRRNDPWLMGKGNSPRVYDDIDVLLRDAAQVERLERLTEPLPVRGPNGSASPRASRPVQPSHGADPYQNADIVRPGGATA